MLFKIANIEIGPNYPTYIIAELSCNHNKDKNSSDRIIDGEYSIVDENSED